ncbi:MAG: S1 RNA-binding domain-containing protein [Armatimonadota bacterium]|nr:S1 RNA-binding domain-containing protein [Armatimonadota bacterium]
MAVEVGQIVRGTVVRLLNYGVLVRLEDGTTGLVHISEIDQNYVRDVNEYFQLNDPVTVKVLATGERGKTELSIKQARAAGETGPMPRPADGEVQSDNGTGAAAGAGENRGPGEGAVSRRESRASFEEKMGDFLRHSSERLGDLKRNIENKRGGKKTR